MAEGLHVHIHCAWIRTSSPLWHNRYTQITIKTHNSQVLMVSVLYLQADGQVNPGAVGCADSPGRQPHVLKQLGEGVCQGQARALLCYDHTATHAWQVDTPSLKHTHNKWRKPKAWCCICHNSPYVPSLPWVTQSECPVLWCTAPWQSKSRRCLWCGTDWACSATETSSSPAQKEESGWTGDLSKHCEKREEHYWLDCQALGECSVAVGLPYLARHHKTKPRPQ